MDDYFTDCVLTEANTTLLMDFCTDVLAIYQHFGEVYVLMLTGLILICFIGSPIEGSILEGYVSGVSLSTINEDVCDGLTFIKLVWAVFN